ncbi:MAG: hypothetical protein NVS9B15_20950 [Acidobacteriaceae bacterium]
MNCCIHALTISIVLTMRFPESTQPWVLCVDDNQSAVTVRGAILELHGYRVSLLTSEREALNFLDANSVDAVVLDYLMPDITGDALATMIREKHPDTPVILISGAVDNLNDIGGAQVFVSKSAGVGRLIEVLSAILQRKEGAAA